MSWSIGATLYKDDVDNANTIAFQKLHAIDRSQIGNQQCTKERDEQIDTAIAAVAKLLSEGGFSNAAEVSVSISGHANKEHQKEQEWANDYISIQLHINRYVGE